MSTKRKRINNCIKMDNGIVFHLGRPELLPTTVGMDTVSVLDNSLPPEIAEVEKERVASSLKIQ